MIHGLRKQTPMILDPDARFSKIASHLPTDTRGNARVDDRRIIGDIVHVLKSGGRWIDAPPEYGPKKTLYNRYVRWAAKGVWVDLFHALAQAGRGSHQVNARLLRGLSENHAVFPIRRRGADNPTSARVPPKISQPRLTDRKRGAYLTSVVVEEGRCDDASEACLEGQAIG